MNSDEKTGLFPEISSIVFIVLLFFFFPVIIEASFFFRVLPIAIPPFFLVWSPESVSNLFSSQTSINTIRLWGGIGFVVLSIPLGLYFVWGANLS